MPRQSQLLELDLRSGVVTNESLYVIGPRLWRATNSVWQYRYPRATVPRMHMMPQAVTLADAVTYTGATAFRDIGYTRNATIATVGGSPNIGILVFGAGATGYYSAWRYTTGGTELPFDGTAVRVPLAGVAAAAPGWSLRWDTPGTNPRGGGATSDGVTIFGHPGVVRVYYLLDTDTAIYDLSTDIGATCPLGAHAGTIHLDRLWLIQTASAFASIVYYTDPFNLDSIRTTNTIRVRGRATALCPGQFGAIDASGVAHLVIGTLDGVYVLDGDPQLGGGLQADLRTLSTTVGVLNAHSIAVTRFGVFFFGTDGDLWWIPPGCQDMRPVGGPIYDQLGQAGVSGTLQYDWTSPSSLLWFDPYLYLFPGGETQHHWLAEPSAEGVRFWGPVVGDSDVASREAVIRQPLFDYLYHNVGGVDGLSMNSVTRTPVAGLAQRASIGQRFGNNYHRTASVQTGLMNVAGHRVQATRVILETLRQPLTAIGSATPVWSVTATDELGRSVTGSLHPEPAVPVGTNLQTVTQTQHFALPPLPASRGIAITISVTTEADLCLQRAFVELHTTPAQF
jgi:hypothetical protein